MLWQKKTLRADTPKNSGKVFSVTQVENLEKVMLFDSYVLLIPKEVADEWEIHPKYKLHDESGAINIHQAAHLKDMIWGKLIDSQAKIKEASTENSHVFNYEVTIDFSLACVYARPINDLVTE